jgi:hypothetical protein
VIADETPADRLRLAFGLHELGRAMYRARLQRAHPDWSADRLDAAVDAWLESAPLQGRPAPPDRLARILRRAGRAPSQR